MAVQQQTNEELCNLFIQSLEAKDEKTILKILECDDEATIRDVINRIPVHHVRKLIIELRNVLSQQLTTNHLRWLQQVLVLKFSALASMADNRSIILPLISLLDDRSSPAYYMKMQALKGKISLLKQLKETRNLETQETVVRVTADRDQPAHMEIDTESETDSEEEEEDDIDDDDDDDEGGSGGGDGNEEEEDLEEDNDSDE
uniref:Small-subunit processome Utp12 domain-containing protein n=1 Tax=Aceria tosichella TaxID=561515 RepID=A0A6G1SIC9_9ACAR